MIKSDAVVILVTVPTRDEAQMISQLLVGERKAACVNIVSQIDSIFWWEGKIDSEKECILVVKTKASLLDEVTNMIKQAHSYEVPEVIAMPIIGGNEDYLKWLNNEIE